jgi:tetratricopeptide (TPR) repeat protein
VIRTRPRWARLAALLALLVIPQPTRAQEPEAVPQRWHAATRTVMRLWAQAWGAEAVQARDAGRYQLAKRAYERYLAEFPSGPEHYSMQYAYADLLWRMASHASRSSDRRERQQAPDYFRQAHEQFVRTLELDPEGEFTVAAAWWQVEAMRNHLRYREPSPSTKACSFDVRGVCSASVDYSPIELSVEAQRMLAAYDTFLKYVKDPKVAELAEVSRWRVQLLIRHNRFDEAELALTQSIDSFADLDHAREHFVSSVDALIDVLTVQWLRAGHSPQRVLATGDALEAWVAKLDSMDIWKGNKLEALRGHVGYLLGAVAWRSALAHRELGEFVECAAQFVELHDRWPEHSDASTMLWNAAECLAADSKGGEVVQMLETLLERHPDSEHAPDAMLRLGEGYQAIAYPEHAARHYESFAEGFPSDERADDALENAYLLRLGLGHAEQAQADLRRFERLYRRDDVGRSHALEYLQSYGRKDGLDRVVVAEAVIGQIDWRRSCPEPLLHDSCITIKRRQISAYILKAWGLEPQRKSKRFRPPHRCGLPTQSLVYVDSRDPKLSAAAQARFSKVLALAPEAAPPADDPRRVADFRWAWGMAAIYQADQHFEEWLRLELPDDLDFHVEAWRRDSGVKSWERKYAAQVRKREQSNARLGEFIEHKTRLAEDLQARYGKVDETNSAAWMLAAAARTAAIQQLFADQLLRALVPQTFTDREQVLSYCDALAERAEPIRAQAIAAYKSCLARATEVQHANEFSRMCEEELQQLDELASPATHELFGEPIVTSSRIESVGVLADP